MVSILFLQRISISCGITKSGGWLFTQSTMGLFGLAFLLLALIPLVFAQEVTLVVDGTKTIAETDNNFICATMDWWPHDKCNYNICPWGYASAINLNLSHPYLEKAIQAFNSLRIRIGGSLQDQMLYDIGKLEYPCHPFRKDKSGLFSFSKGCLHMDRWDQLNALFIKARAIVTFGLNALYGRHQIRQNLWGGDWDYSNTYEFMKYTAAKGYPVDSWEFGNELCGNGVGARVTAEQYGKDVITLKAIINELYKNVHTKPSLVAPGGFFDQDWFKRFLQVSGTGVVNVVTHHIYNLGPGSDPNLVGKILDPKYLSRISKTFNNLKKTIKNYGPWASPWVGESGGAYNSGGQHVSDTFVNSFWYLDQLGMAATYHTKAYCRQTLIGGNYGLIDKDTFIPNPDYYSALLWHRLMGKGVLAADGSASPFLRHYVHCSKGRAGLTMLLLNLSNQTNYKISIQNSMNNKLRIEKPINQEGTIIRVIKDAFSFVGFGSSDEPFYREEYHLTPEDGYIRSKTMLLNGIPLKIAEDGNIPDLKPRHVDVRSPISISPLSIAFIVFPNFDAPGCL